MLNKIKKTTETKSDAALTIAGNSAAANKLEQAPTPEMSRIDLQMAALREEANRLIRLDVLTRQEQLLRDRINQQVRQLQLRRQAIAIAQLVFGHQSVMASMETIIVMVDTIIRSLTSERPAQLTTLNTFLTSPSAQAAALAPALATSAAADANVAIGNMIDALYILRADVNDLNAREAAIRVKMEAGITKINGLNTEAGLRIEDILNNRTFYADYNAYLGTLSTTLEGLEDSLSDAETRIEELKFTTSPEYDAAVADKARLEAQIETLMSELDAGKRRQSEFSSESIAALEALEQAQTDKETAVNNFFETFSGDLAAATSALGRSNSGYASAKQALESISAEYDRLNNPSLMTALTTSRDSVVVPPLSDTATALQTELRTQTANLDAINRSIQIIEEQLSSAQTRRSETISAMDTSQQELQILQQNANDLRMIIETLTKLLQDASTKNGIMEGAYNFMTGIDGLRVVPSTAEMDGARALLETAEGILSGLNTQIDNKNASMVIAQSMMSFYANQIAEKGKYLGYLTSLATSLETRSQQAALDLSDPVKPSATAAAAIVNATKLVAAKLDGAEAQRKQIVSDIAAKEGVVRQRRENGFLAKFQSYYESLMRIVFGSMPTNDGRVAAQIALIEEKKAQLEIIKTVDVAAASTGVAAAEGSMTATGETLSQKQSELSAFIESITASIKSVGSNLYGLLSQILSSFRGIVGTRADPAANLDLSSPTKPSLTAVTQLKGQKTAIDISIVQTSLDLEEVKAKLVIERKRIFGIDSNESLALRRDRILSIIKVKQDGRPTADGRVAARITALDGVRAQLSAIVVPDVPSTADMDAAKAILDSAIGSINALIAENNALFMNKFKLYTLSGSLISEKTLPPVAVDTSDPTKPSLDPIRGINAQRVAIDIGIVQTNLDLEEVKAGLAIQKTSLTKFDSSESLALLSNRLLSIIKAEQDGRPSADGRAAARISQLEAVRTELSGIVVPPIPSTADMDAAKAVLDSAIGRIEMIIAENNALFMDKYKLYSLSGTLEAGKTLPPIDFDTSDPEKPSVTSVIELNAEQAAIYNNLVQANNDLEELKGKLIIEQTRLLNIDSSESLALRRDNLLYIIKLLQDGLPSADGRAAESISALDGVRAQLSAIVVPDVPSSADMDAAKAILDSAIGSINTLIAENNALFMNKFKLYSLSSSLDTEETLAPVSVDTSDPAKPSLDTITQLKAQKVAIDISLIQTNLDLEEVKAGLAIQKTSLTKFDSSESLALLSNRLLSIIKAEQDGRPTADGRAAGIISQLEAVRAELSGIVVPDVPSTADMDAAKAILDSATARIEKIIAENNAFFMNKFKLYSLSSTLDTEETLVPVSVDTSDPEKPSVTSVIELNAERAAIYNNLVQANNDLEELKAKLVIKQGHLLNINSNEPLALRREHLLSIIKIAEDGRPTADGRVAAEISGLDTVRAQLSAIVVPDVPSTADMDAAKAILDSAIGSINALIAENNALFMNKFKLYSLSSTLDTEETLPPEDLDTSDPTKPSLDAIYQIMADRLRTEIEERDANQDLDRTKAELLTLYARLLQVQMNALIAYKGDSILSIIEQLKRGAPDIDGMLQALNEQTERLANILNIELPNRDQSVISAAAAVENMLTLITSTNTSINALIGSNSDKLKEIALYYNMVEIAFKSITVIDFSYTSAVASNSYLNQFWGFITSTWTTTTVAPDPEPVKLDALMTVERLRYLMGEMSKVQTNIDDLRRQYGRDLMGIGVLLEDAEMRLERITADLNNKSADMVAAQLAMIEAETILANALAELNRLTTSLDKSSDTLLLLARLIDAIRKAKSLATQLNANLRAAEAASDSYLADMNAARTQREGLTDPDVDASKNAALASVEVIRFLDREMARVKDILDPANRSLLLTNEGIEVNVDEFVDKLDDYYASLKPLREKALNELIDAYVGMMNSKGILDSTRRYLDMTLLSGAINSKDLESLRATLLLLEGYRTNSITRDVVVANLKGLSISFQIDLLNAFIQKNALENVDPSGLKDDINGTLGRIQGLRDAMNDTKDDTEADEKRIDDINKEIANLMIVYGRTIAILEGSRKSPMLFVLNRLATLQLNRSNLRIQINSIMETLQQLNQDSNANKAEIARLEALMLTLFQQMTNINRQITDTQIAIIKLLQDNVAFLDQIEKLQQLRRDAEASRRGGLPIPPPSGIAALLAFAAKNLGPIAAGILGGIVALVIATNTDSPPPPIGGCAAGEAAFAKKSGIIGGDAFTEGARAAREALGPAAAELPVEEGEEAEAAAEEAEAEEAEGEEAEDEEEDAEEEDEDRQRMKGGNPDAAQLGIAASNDVDMTDAPEMTTPDDPQIKLAEKPVPEPVPEEPAPEPATEPLTEEETETDIASEEASDVAAEGPEGEDPSIENPTRLPWDKSTATPSDTLIFRYLNTSLPKPISSYPASWQAECRTCWKRKFVPFWLKKHKAGWESMMNKFAATLGSSGASGLNGQNDQSSTIDESEGGPKDPDAAQKEEGARGSASGGGRRNNSGYAYY